MRKTAQQLFEEISKFVNSARLSEVKELATLLSKDHPTLQQSTMKLCTAFVQEMAKKSHTDLRNGESKKMAQEMINGYKSYLTQKFIDQDMNNDDAEKQAEACIQDLPGNLPLI